MPRTEAGAAPPVWILDRVQPGIRIFGLDPALRLERGLARAGCHSIVRIAPGAPTPPPDAPSILVIRPDLIFDERLLEALVATPGTALAAPNESEATLAAAHVVANDAAGAFLALASADAQLPSAIVAKSAAEIAPSYDAALRKSSPPLLLAVRPETAREIEDALFAASYKGLTDLVTKWLWPAPAIAVVRALARLRVPPNAVTVASWIFAVLAFFQFAAGSFGAGLLSAWLMTFLDTVDGKLARVTLSSSRVGHVLDHGLDLVHPPFWWLAWGVGLGAGAAIDTAIVVGGYLVGRGLEGIFLLAFQMETHCWRPIDGLFRTVTARRNPNLILLTVGTAGGRPDLGFTGVALWTLASLAFHAIRLTQAFAHRRRGDVIVPWDASSSRRGP